MIGDGRGDRLGLMDDASFWKGDGPDGDDEMRLIGLEVFGDISIAAGG